jgi:uncharacterized protein
MYLNWEYSEPFQDKLHDEDREWSTTEVSPLLSETGEEFEATQVDSIVDADTLVIADSEDALSVDVDNTWDFDPEDEYEARLNDGRNHFRLILQHLKGDSISERKILLHQAPMRETIFGYEVGGFADLLLLEQTDDGVVANVIEIKSADKQKVPHQIQAVTYTLLLEEAAADVGLTLQDCTTRVVTEAGRLTRGLIDEQEFEAESRKADVRMFLQENGILEQALDHSEFDDSYREMRNRIGPRCSSCSYEPMCMGRMAEKDDYGLELLQLEPETQRAIEACGVDSLRDMADLYIIEDEDDDSPSVTTFTELRPRNSEARDTIEQIKRQTNLSNIQTRAQIAHRFVEELDMDEYGGDYFGNELQGSGYNLPADYYYPSGEDDDGPDSPVTWGDVPWDSLIRVYIHVQHDPILDRLTGLAAHVECNTPNEAELDEEEEDGTRDPINPLTLSLDEETQDTSERDLLFNFFGQVAERINEVAPDVSGDYEGEADAYDSLDANQGFVHLYLYGNHQRKQLVEAVRRHNELRWSPPVRRLLGFRKNIDQGMVSVIEDELVQRHALRFPGLGLPQTVAQFYDDDWFDWNMDRPDGTGFTPGEYFDEGLFEAGVSKNRSRYEREGEIRGFDYSDYQSIVGGGGESQLLGGLYPVINRNLRQIPPEYVYAAYGKLEEALGVDVDRRNDEDIGDEEAEFLERVHRFRTRFEEHPVHGNWVEITEEDVKLLMLKFAEAVKFIERSVRYRDRSYQKGPIDLQELTELEPVESSLAETCIEYQQLEHQEEIENVESDLRKPLGQRLGSGGSLLFRCEHCPPDPDGDESIHIAGELVDENFDVATGDDLANNPINVSENDWKVISRVDPDTDDRPEIHRYSTPESIQQSPVAIVHHLDLDEGRITVNIPFPNIPFPNDSYAYMVDHNSVDIVDDIDPEGENYVTQLSEGEYYVIDDLVDDISNARAYSALEACCPDEDDDPDEFVASNSVYCTLESVYSGENTDLEIDQWSEDAVNGYLENLEDEIDAAGDGCDFSTPNTEQESFITDVDLKISTLQGPPGTGKTSTASAPSILSRVFAAATDDSNFAGIVSAYSHEAVEEVLEDVHDLASFYPPSEDLKLVRVNPKESAEEHANVEYLNYHDNSDDDEMGDSDELAALFEEYVMTEDAKQVVFFGPPVSIRGLINNVADQLTDDSDPDAEDLYEDGECAIFDFGLIDEASMMDLPLMFLFGAFLADESQLQMVGDHQQMQPIQQHDWEAEDRRSLERNPPYLSTLDFIRFLREELEEEKREYFDRDPPEWEGIGGPDEDEDDLLPIHRLVKTYRLPAESAWFHTDLIYFPRDGIQLESQIERDPIELADDVPAEFETILSPSDRVTLVVHEDESATTYSEVEADIIEGLFDHLDISPVTEDDDEDGSGYTAGVVVPYNDQVTLVSDRLDEDITVDTVEQFQGDQREVMVLSMTGSAPGHVTSQSEFLQNPHRLNVGASRMQRKVIILASRSIFEAVTPDGDTAAYDEQLLWKRMYQGMGGFSGGEDDTFDLSEFSGAVVDDDAEAKVFNGWPEESIHEEIDDRPS